MDRVEQIEKLSVCLAEYASIHKDGTTSVVRGWLCRWTFDEFPVETVAYAVLDIPIVPSLEYYPLKFELVGPNAETIFVAEAKAKRGEHKPGSSRRFQVVLPIVIQLPSIGDYVLKFDVAGNQTDVPMTVYEGVSNGT